MIRRVGAAVLVALWCVSPVAARAGADQIVAPQPGPKDLCPVCGMIVSKYRNWTATVVWKDGRADYFDGAKDMFKFLQALPEYARGRTRDGIKTIVVTEFYDLKPIDARGAWYVIGSDVLGPMGYELVPLATKVDADDFLKDHLGTRILRFDEITPAIIAKVDAGRLLPRKLAKSPRPQ
ncbi:MAG: nitrous oxide reductase accessory protein NosL [Acidobacteriota bacterium]